MATAPTAPVARMPVRMRPVVRLCMGFLLEIGCFVLPMLDRETVKPMCSMWRLDVDFGPQARHAPEPLRGTV